MTSFIFQKWNIVNSKFTNKLTFYSCHYSFYLTHKSISNNPSNFHQTIWSSPSSRFIHQKACLTPVWWRNLYCQICRKIEFSFISWVINSLENWLFRRKTLARYEQSKNWAHFYGIVKQFPFLRRISTVLASSKEFQFCWTILNFPWNIVFGILDVRNSARMLFVALKGKFWQIYAYRECVEFFQFQKVLGSNSKTSGS